MSELTVVSTSIPGGRVRVHPNDFSDTASKTLIVQGREVMYTKSDDVTEGSIEMNMTQRKLFDVSEGDSIIVDVPVVEEKHTTKQIQKPKPIVKVEDEPQNEESPNEEVEKEYTPQFDGLGTKTTKDELPLTYKDMGNTEEDVQVTIGPDLGEDGAQPHNGKYIALFQNKTTSEQKTVQLEDLGHVNRFRDGLCLKGWRMVKPPKIDITKKQVRKLQRQNDRMSEKLVKREEKRKKAVQARKERLAIELQKRKEFARALAEKKKK